MHDAEKQDPYGSYRRCISVRHITFIFSYRHVKKIMYYEDQHETTSEIVNDSDVNLASQTLENTASTSSLS